MGQDIIYMEQLKGIFETDYEKVEEKEHLQILLKRIKAMSEQEKQICCLYFGIGYKRGCSQLEVAKILGLSQSYVSRKLAKMIIALRAGLYPYDELERVETANRRKHYKQLSLYK